MKLLPAILLAAISFTFASCGPRTPEEKLLGQWALEKDGKRFSFIFGSSKTWFLDVASADFKNPSAPESTSGSWSIVPPDKLSLQVKKTDETAPAETIEFNFAFPNSNSLKLQGKPSLGLSEDSLFTRVQQ